MKLDTMKTDFVNNITHELRTHPGPILRSSNEALANFGVANDRESLTRYLAINEMVINDLDKNIERMMDYSRRKRLEGRR